MTDMFMQVLWLLAIDAIFLVVLALILVPLAIYKHAAFAVLRRNFVSYFSNPTGYVFLCLFVLLTSFAAFWPHEFFTSNLANLDQLNRFLPFIMLIFIPAITMGTWSEEKRQGTDELLLTIPADDFDIVIGKYLAAVGVFTVSLLFSQLSNFVALVSLSAGEVDTGLFFANYFGYWVIGLSMIAVGMIGSFLSSNLTVSFILGAIFNAPLTFATFADAILPPPYSDWVTRWSVAAQFEPFGRGVLSLSSLVYFLMVAAIGLYICIILVGRRHWLGGRDGDSLIFHYMVRVLSLVVIVISVTAIFSARLAFRADLTRNRTASLSPATLRILKSIEPEHPIFVHAFISRKVPKEYAEVKRNLLSLLREFEAQGKIKVKIFNNIETFSDEARKAEERFGITAQRLRFRERGQIDEEEVILGAAFTSGLNRVVVPFFDYGIPVEYELIRSIATVAKKKRKKLGVIDTDANLSGGFTFSGGRPQQLPKQPVIEELEKQYEIERVDATKPIDATQFDALLVVQPSTLPPEGLENLIAAIRAGVPTAVFEDPYPYFFSHVPPTGQPKSPPGGMGGMPMPKSDIRDLWKVLGISAPGRINQRSFRPPPLFQPDVAWQHYNPYRKIQIQAFTDEWVFIRNEAPGGSDSLNPAEDITSGLEEVLLPYPGSIEPTPDSNLRFVKLIQTGNVAGTIPYDDLMAYEASEPARLQTKQVLRGRQVLAARIRGQLEQEDDSNAADEGSSNDDKAKNNQPKEAKKGINVVYVADMDLLAPVFFSLRARPDEMSEIRWRFENVTFVLNLIDELSGDDAFVAVRNHKPRHATLRLVEIQIQAAKEKQLEKEREFRRKYEKAVEKAEKEKEDAGKKIREKLEQLQKKREQGEPVNVVDIIALSQQAQAAEARANRRLQIRRVQLEKERDQEIKRIRREVDLEILGIQFFYKAWVVAFPPILPALVGIFVFFRRLLREREGIETARLK